jgi:GDPmannose 4,6-dehydratase
MTKRALITGITGQDGAYLSRLLLEKGYEVVGAFRRASDLIDWRLRFLGVADDVRMIPLELLEQSNITRMIEEIRPTEIYNLAAQSFVGTSFEQPIYTADVNALGVFRLLEAIRVASPETAFYQASTSEMFGGTAEAPQNENTPFHPRSPYGVAKLAAHWATINYRESYEMRCSCGILFNHESPLRGAEFVTRKITIAFARIAQGLQSSVELGNLDAKRDWGHAADYVRGMWMMQQADLSDDFVLGSGETRTVREFVEAAGTATGMKLEWTGAGIDEVGIDANTGRTVVKINPSFYRPAEVDLLLADPKKAEEVLGWKPEISFEALVNEMVEVDMKNEANRIGR